MSKRFLLIQILSLAALTSRADTVDYWSIWFNQKMICKDREWCGDVVLKIINDSDSLLLEYNTDTGTGEGVILFLHDDGSTIKRWVMQPCGKSDNIYALPLSEVIKSIVPGETIHLVFSHRHEWFMEMLAFKIET